MCQHAQFSPIPLPDAEVVSCFTSARVLSPHHSLSQYPDSIRALVYCWALEADAAYLDILMLAWPDNHFCFAVVPRSTGDIPALLAPPAILAAYRHALSDRHAHKLFYPQGEHIERSLR